MRTPPHLGQRHIICGPRQPVQLTCSGHQPRSRAICRPLWVPASTISLGSSRARSLTPTAPQAVRWSLLLLLRHVGGALWADLRAHGTLSQPPPGKRKSSGLTPLGCRHAGGGLALPRQDPRGEGAGRGPPCSALAQEKLWKPAHISAGWCQVPSCCLGSQPLASDGLVHSTALWWPPRVETHASLAGTKPKASGLFTSPRTWCARDGEHRPGCARTRPKTCTQSSLP